MTNNGLTRLMPLLFVLIWATGFIVARGIAPYAAPLTFLSVRFTLSAAAFAGLAVVTRSPWPKTWQGWRVAIISGLLLQGAYLAGVFWSVHQGLPSGIAALVGGLQPLMTACLAGVLLSERVGWQRWLGILIGFAGAGLVLFPKLGAGAGVPLVPFGVCFLGVLGFTLGTIWQKRTGAAADLRTGASIQFMGAAIVAIPLALLTEDVRLDWAWQAWVGLAWAVIGLSLGAISLLLLLIRRGAVSGVASLLYLVPPATSLIAFFAFGEQLAGIQIAGILLAAVGVAVASRSPA